MRVRSPGLPLLLLLLLVLLLGGPLGGVPSVASDGRAARKAMETLGDGRYDAALPIFDEAIAAAPDDEEMHYGRGVCLSRLGRLEEALASLEEALALDPDYNEATVEKARVYISTDDAARARTLLLEAQRNGHRVIAVLDEPAFASLNADVDFLKALLTAENFEFRVDGRRDPFASPLLLKARPVSSDGRPGAGVDGAGFVATAERLYRTLDGQIAAEDRDGAVASFRALQEHLAGVSQVEETRFRQQAIAIRNRLADVERLVDGLRVRVAAEEGRTLLVAIEDDVRGGRDPERALARHRDDFVPFLERLARMDGDLAARFRRVGDDLVERAQILVALGQLSLRVTAVVIGEEGVRLAVIRDEGAGTERAYREGDRIRPDLVVQRIASDEVLLLFRDIHRFPLQTAWRPGGARDGDGEGSNDNGEER